MTLAWRTALLLAAALAGPAGATAVPPPASPPVVRVQAQDIPAVVRLLAQRAARAERRGDMATAEALYEAIRELGYVVQRRRPGPARPDGGDGKDRQRDGGGQDRDRGGGGRDDDDDRDDDDGDDDGEDDDDD